jgi:hypothetical protein
MISTSNKQTDRQTDRHIKYKWHSYAHINSLPWGYTPGTLKKHDSNALIPPPSPGKCVSQTALPLGLRIK